MPRFMIMAALGLLAALSAGCLALPPAPLSYHPPPYAPPPGLGSQQTARSMAQIDQAASQLAGQLVHNLKPGAPRRVAVLDPVGPSQRISDFSVYLGDKLIQRLVGLGAFSSVLERRRLQEVLVQQQLELGGQFDPSTMAPLGRKLGVDALVLGTVRRMGRGLVQVNLRLVKAASGEVASTAEASLEAGPLVDQMLSRVLTADLRVMAEPAGVRGAASLDGRSLPLGSAGALFRRVPQGVRTVSISAPGYETVNKSIYLSGNRTLRFSLSALPARAQAAPATGPTVRPALSLAFSAVFPDGRGGLRQLREGSQLLSGSSYAMSFRPRTDCYVYIFQADSRQGLFQLFPRPEAAGSQNPSRAGRRYRVPLPGQWLRLDQRPGRERILVVLSRRPLPALQAEAYAQGGSSEPWSRRQRRMDLLSQMAHTSPAGLTAPQRRPVSFRGRTFWLDEQVLLARGDQALYSLSFLHR